jgi:hypothetical protein
MRQEFAKTNRSDEFKIEPLSPAISCKGFKCTVVEYDNYLSHDALRSMNDHIALTWLLIERSSGKIAAYMPLIMDTNKIVTHRERTTQP